MREQLAINGGPKTRTKPFPLAFRVYGNFMRTPDAFGLVRNRAIELLKALGEPREPR